MILVDNNSVILKDALVTSGGFTTSGNSVNMAKYRRCRVKLTVTPSSSGDQSAAVTFKQGSDSTPGTTLNFTRYFRNLTALSGPTLDEVSASSLTIGKIAGGVTAQYIWEFQAQDLTDGNSYLRCNVAALSALTAASLEYELYMPRYPADAEQMVPASS